MQCEAGELLLLNIVCFVCVPHTTPQTVCEDSFWVGEDFFLDILPKLTNFAAR